MSKITPLKKDIRNMSYWAEKAMESIRFRGHIAGRFKRNYEEGIATYKCKKCGAIAVVTLNPMPNEARIVGNAVAINCK